MARRSISLEEKIEKQKAAVMSAKEKYETEQEKLQQLQQKRLELQSKELVKAFEGSPRSIEEVLAFLKGEEDG